MHEFRYSQDRGRADFGWLQSQHSFSFGSYMDPAHQGYSDLLVINEDRVQPGKGFGTHSHRDMEILSYVLSGALEHKDSMGTGSVIHPGDVQIMGAGRGISHSEFNHSTSHPVHFLQIWVQPHTRGLDPRYQQQHIGQEKKRGQLACIASPEGRNGSVLIHQDTCIYAGNFDGSESATLELAEGRLAYVHLARGQLQVNGLPLKAGDAIKLKDERHITLSQGSQAEVLVFDLRNPSTR